MTVLIQSIESKEIHRQKKQKQQNNNNTYTEKKHEKHI